MIHPGPVRWTSSLLLVVLLLTPTGTFRKAWSADLAPMAASAALEPGTVAAHPGAGTRLFATVGLGFLDTKHDVGADIPLGGVLLLPRWRLLATASVLDVAMVEGNDRDRRYYRPRLGYSYCVDSLTGRLVPEHYCSGGTNFTRSSAVDLSYILLDEVWFSDKVGNVRVGMGYRFRRPDNAYATLGVLFPSGRRRAMGARLDIGPDFVHMGVTWGWDMVRFIRP